jgi:GT2 family glycosyltransferase
MLDVVLVNWNSGEHLTACIASVLSSPPSAALVGELIVVDNASTDDSAERAQSVAPGRVRVIRNDHNAGFGRACNQGARLGTSELLLFLNPDMVLQPQSVDRAVQALQEHPTVAVCGIRLVDQFGVTARTCARKPTAWSMCLFALGLDRLAPTRMPAYVMTEWDHQQTRLVDHVIGAFYLVRRPVFESLGGFDERFFMYLEDLDLSCRIQEHGWKCLYLAEVQAFHEGGGSSKKVLAKRLFYSVRSRLQYAAKHFGVPGCLAVTATSLLVEPLVRAALAVARVDFKTLRHTAEGYGMLYSWFAGSAVKLRSAT